LETNGFQTFLNGNPAAELTENSLIKNRNRMSTKSTHKPPSKEEVERILESIDWNKYWADVDARIAKEADAWSEAYRRSHQYILEHPTVLN